VCLNLDGARVVVYTGRVVASYLLSQNVGVELMR
jgi:hypothetical protein